MSCAAGWRRARVQAAGDLLAAVDLPDETLLPFEGSGIETVWELMLSKIGNANGCESVTDVLITSDMRASYSAALDEPHTAALPASATRTLLASAWTTPFTATFSSANPVQSEEITFEAAVALSTAGALAGGNGGVRCR